jgi:hypothetical protein
MVHQALEQRSYDTCGVLDKYCLVWCGRVALQGLVLHHNSEIGLSGLQLILSNGSAL